MNDIEVLEQILKDVEKVNLITLLRTFKKEGLENFIVIRKNKFENLLKERQSDKERIKHLSSVSDYETICLECNNLEEQLEIANDRIKELEEINEAHKKENGELREELESVKEIYYTQKEIKTDYISKSLIKEKIEPVINKLEKNGFIGYADEIRDIVEELLNTKM